MSHTNLKLLDLDYLREIEDLTPGDGRGGSLIPGLLKDFEKNLPELLENLHRQWQSKNSSGLERAAHALKSSASALGAVHVRSLCQEIETAAESESFPPSSSLEILERELGRTVDAIEFYIGKKVA